ncbi:MAG: hydantoinase B/oxoprolinase family protein, partial [Myxococcales bacterium]|nr:hydantoinase B/oxoprolinase family protein [Myxococcales bacterium]
VNIRERLDFSCAVFDGDGRLVANAPHIPVHLGAMGETVRDLIARAPGVGLDPAAPAQHWLTNDPAAGGSHLPDLTVVTPVHHDGARFFVASRGHHVDVGGVTPGSVPPRSTRLADEGFVVRQLPLLEPDGSVRALAPHLVGCRDVGTVSADLEAQIAANAHAARRLGELGPAALVATWMGHLHDVAAEATRALCARLPAGSASDDLDGVPLVVRLTPNEDDAGGGGLVIDFSGTGGPHAGNLNAPPAVVRAAVLFAVRTLIGRPIPLNEGCLAPVRLVIPAPSVLAPPEGAAVVGGNVETSQRLVDLLLAAAGARAGSAGTMVNLTLGGDGFAYYETLGGGLGATRDHAGASGRQTHMTNTRATDPEVVEARLPLRVRRFALRPGSGGAGARRGGDGLVRELVLTRPGGAALLAAFRPGGAPGLDGGAPGAPGFAEVRVVGRWRPWDGAPITLDAGDRVRVHTPGGGGAGRPPEEPQLADREEIP